MEHLDPDVLAQVLKVVATAKEVGIELEELMFNGMVIKFARGPLITQHPVVNGRFAVSGHDAINSTPTPANGITDPDADMRQRHPGYARLFPDGFPKRPPHVVKDE